MTKKGEVKMKKLISTTLAFTMIAAMAFSGCSSQNTQTADAPKTETTTPADTTADAGEKKTVDYPTKPLTLFCGFSAGGSSDLLCRITATNLEKYLGQPVTVVNKDGGGGWVTYTEMIKNVEPDGYTFCLINTPNLTMGKFDDKNPREYEWSALDVICNQITDPSVMAMRKDEDRFTDFASFVEYAKENEVICGSSAIGIMSDDGTIIERCNKEFGTKISIVQTKGAKDCETMLLNKSADIYVGNVSDVFTAHNNGDYKTMVVFNDKKVDFLPDVPTIEECGFGAVYGSSSRGYALPKGVDPAVREILADALDKTINDPETMQQLADIGGVTVYIAGKDYEDFLAAQVELCKSVYGIQ